MRSMFFSSVGQKAHAQLTRTFIECFAKIPISFLINLQLWKCCSPVWRLARKSFEFCLFNCLIYFVALNNFFVVEKEKKSIFLADAYKHSRLKLNSSVLPKILWCLTTSQKLVLLGYSLMLMQILYFFNKSKFRITCTET